MRGEDFGDPPKTGNGMRKANISIGEIRLGRYPSKSYIRLLNPKTGKLTLLVNCDAKACETHQELMTDVFEKAVSLDQNSTAMKAYKDARVRELRESSSEETVAGDKDGRWFQ